MSEKEQFRPAVVPRHRSGPRQVQSRHPGRARGIVRAFAEWFRSLVLRSIQLARRLAAKRRIYIDIPEPQQFDDRILADIGITMDKGAKFDGQKHSSGNKPLHPQQVAVVATS